MLQNREPSSPRGFLPLSFFYHSGTMQSVDSVDKAPRNLIAYGRAELMVRPPRSTAEPSLHGVEEGRVRSSIIPACVAAWLVLAAATTADADTFVLQHDA